MHPESMSIWEQQVFGLARAIGHMGPGRRIKASNIRLSLSFVLLKGNHRRYTRREVT